MPLKQRPKDKNQKKEKGKHVHGHGQHQPEPHAEDQTHKQKPVSKHASKFVRVILKIWKSGLQHCILLIILVLYTIFGALLFQEIEKYVELANARRGEKARDEYLEEIWELTKSPDMNYETWFKKIFEKFEENKDYFCVDQAWAETFIRKWNYENAVTFATSVYFAIGYGNMVPVTTFGRLATIMYGIIGIPFVLYSLAFYGELFTTWMRKSWNGYLHFYYTGKIGKFQLFKTPLVRTASKALWTLDAMGITFGGRPKREFIGEGEKLWLEKVAGKAEHADFELPLTVAAGIVIFFIGITGYMIYTYIEDWTAIEAYYYLFIVLTTIGFGDLVITNTVHMIGLYCAMFFGLVMMTMLLGVIQAKVAKLTKTQK